MSAVTTRRSSSTCIFEDLERKEEVQDVGTALGISSPLKSQINSYSKSNPETNSEFEDANLAESSAVSTVSIGEMCKICHCGVEASASLIAPCYCSGSLKYVHQECLQRWIKSSDIKRCELCKYPFAMQAKVSLKIDFPHEHIVKKLLKMSLLKFWHFPPIFVRLKLTCLVTLFDRKLQVLKNSPKLTFDELLSTQNVNVARFARKVE